MKRVKKIIVKLLVFIGIKQCIERFLFIVKNFITVKYNNFFNKIVRLQNKNNKSIPIIIISFNQYTYIKKLVSFLLENKFENIVILDNNSTYPPLINYYKEIKSIVKIHYLNRNFGHLAFWENKHIFEKYSKGYYAITDPDILPIENCPSDFMELFKKLIDENLNVSKVGFSLKIDDLPSTNKNKELVLNWEKQFWELSTSEGHFKADIDTTFAIYRPNSINTEKYFCKALRTKYPYTAYHLGWYIDSSNLTDEVKYLYRTSNTSSSWKVDEELNIIKKLYKRNN